MKLLNTFFGYFVLFLATIPCAQGESFADVEFLKNAISVRPVQQVDAISVRIVGNNFSFQQQFSSEDIFLNLSSMQLVADGAYRYEITGVSYTGEVQAVSGNGRAPGAVMKKSVVNTLSGKFKLSDQIIITPH